MNPTFVYKYEIATDGTAQNSETTTSNAGEIPENSWQWCHLDRTNTEAVSWIQNDSAIPEIAIDALLAEETRPRVRHSAEGTIVILRGVNTNEGSEPEDMVSIRLWIEDKRIISLRRQKIRAIRDISDAFANQAGPETIGDFVQTLTNSLISRVSDIVLELEDSLDELEETGSVVPTALDQTNLIALRRKAIPFKRFISPQREALIHLYGLKAKWMNPETAARIHESIDQSTRLVEALDSIRERAGLLHEEFSNRIAERTNKNMYLLSIVAAIFLPLGLITGLFGVNVGGIPGVESSLGFIGLTVVLVILGIAQYLFLKLLRWF